VVRIDLQIALACELKIKESMTREPVQHMIKKPDSGINPALPAAIEIDCHLYIRLFCGACYGCRSAHGNPP
jgi:hypothetical protein